MRCLIVDDSEEFLASAARLLETQGIDVVGRARSSHAAVVMAAQTRPDVVLVDIELGDEDGVELTRRLAASAPALRVVLISAHAREDLDELLAECPALGFLPKLRLSAGAIAELLG